MSRRAPPSLSSEVSNRSSCNPAQKRLTVESVQQTASRKQDDEIKLMVQFIQELKKFNQSNPENTVSTTDADDKAIQQIRSLCKMSRSLQSLDTRVCVFLLIVTCLVFLQTNHGHVLLIDLSAKS